MSEQVKLFISYGQVLTELLKSNGNDLSDLELHALKSQLHVMADRVMKVQAFRRLGEAA